MAVDSAELVQAAMMLRENNPRGWDDFVLALRRYSAGVNAEMVKAAPELLLRAQGMALMANELAMLCHDVPALWDRLRAVRAAEDSRRRIKPGE
jgi:hypothetical protein